MSSMFTEAATYDRYMQYTHDDTPYASYEAEFCRKCGELLRDDEGWTCAECLDMARPPLGEDM